MDTNNWLLFVIAVIFFLYGFITHKKEYIYFAIAAIIACQI